MSPPNNYDGPDIAESLIIVPINTNLISTSQPKLALDQNNCHLRFKERGTNSWNYMADKRYPNTLYIPPTSFQLHTRNLAKYNFYNQLHILYYDQENLKGEGIADLQPLNRFRGKMFEMMLTSLSLLSPYCIKIGNKKLNLHATTILKGKV
jgi:hypothetical protein